MGRKVEQPDCQSLTSSKVDDDVAKKNGVRDHIEDDPGVILGGDESL